MKRTKLDKYADFLASKMKRFQASGFDVPDADLNSYLFDFQKWIVKTALQKGRYAVFADCGLGKTLIQLEWASHVRKHTGQPILILAPLAVSGQTIKEGEKFGIKVKKYTGEVSTGIYISNYEQLENIDCSLFAGVVLDESSIIKNFDGKTRELIITRFADTPYKLACTATPSPNDVMELGNHAEFLNVMSRNEMLSMYFVHDGGETAKWRLKGHAESHFWSFVASWSVMLAKPQDLGFEATGYELPELRFIERRIISPTRNMESLFGLCAGVSVSATTFNQELRATKVPRLEQVAKIVNGSKESFIIWVKQNEEADAVADLVPDAVEVRGSDSTESKLRKVEWFINPDECVCKLKPKLGKIEVCQTPTNINIINNIGTKNSLTESSISKITPTIEKSIPVDTTLSTKTVGTNGLKTRKTKGIVYDESDTLTTPSIGKSAKPTQKISLNESPKQDSETYSVSSTESRSNNTTNYSLSKETPAPFASENLPLSELGNDSTLTIATKRERLGDCSVSTAITPSENSKTIPNSLNGQLCTCGRNPARKILISKTSILGMGVNFQNCHNQVFASLDFSFEGLYQAIRRSYRFGQKYPVNIYLITTDTMQNVIDAIERKEEQFKVMQEQMIQASSEFRGTVDNYVGKYDEYRTDDVTLVKGDCVRLIKDVPDESVGFSIFSPPFASLYTYSDKIEDMGNSASYDDFKYAFNLLVEDLYRVMWPGRNVAVHCMDLPIQKGKEGFIGLRDFSGMILDAFIDAGFIYHSRVTIWKNPVTEMQRTKALGLLHKQLRKDSAMSRVGIPDYLMIFRKEGDGEYPVNCHIDVDTWQKWASPVWYDIDYGKTLNVAEGRHENDERHICPLQLETIERAIALWTNEGDTVLTPFAGIGSEVYQAIKMRRKAIGFELKDTYFDCAVRNTQGAEFDASMPTLWTV